MHDNELRLFMGKGTPSLIYIYLCRALDIAVVGTIFNVFIHDGVSNRDSNLSPPRRRADGLRVEPRSRVRKDYYGKVIVYLENGGWLPFD